MSADDTIAAIATAQGHGAVGIVRVSGPAVATIARTLTGGTPRPRYASYRTVTDGDGNAIDEAIVIYFAGPGSFTGEDTLEIQTHGGHVVARDVLRAVIEAGARAAAPGEFTERAFLNGKIDLLQAEAIADLIDSTSTRAARLARQSLAGDFSRRVEQLGDELTAIRVHLEAALDFPDEVISSATIATLAEQTANVRSDLRVLLSNATTGARLNGGIDIAIIGPPNVGKSTLLNRLAGDDRAIVNAAPGTTRDVLSVEVEIEGLSVRLHDTAGIRETNDPVEREGVTRAKRQLANADAIIHVYTEHDDETRDLLADVSVPLFRVRNKIDLRGEKPAIVRSGNQTEISLSAKTADGVELLARSIPVAFNLAADSDSTVLARDRHLTALTAAEAALRFDPADLYTRAPELGAEQLRQAGQALSRLTGEFTTEDLLGEIFSTFCLGK